MRRLNDMLLVLTMLFLVGGNAGAQQQNVQLTKCTADPVLIVANTDFPVLFTATTVNGPATVEVQRLTAKGVTVTCNLEAAVIAVEVNSLLSTLQSTRNAASGSRPTDGNFVTVNRDVAFVPPAADLMVAVQGGGDITVKAIDIKPADQAKNVSWVIQRNPADTVAANTPTCPCNAGAEVTVTPDTPGNFVRGFRGHAGGGVRPSAKAFVVVMWIGFQPTAGPSRPVTRLMADSDSAAHYLAWLLAKPPLAGMAVYEITDWLTSVFYRLSGSEQDEVTRALANAGSGSNQSVSVAALRSLIRLSDEKLVNLRPYLSQPVSEGLIENYGTLDPNTKQARNCGDNSAWSDKPGGPVVLPDQLLAGLVM